MTPGPKKNRVDAYARETGRLIIEVITEGDLAKHYPKGWKLDGQPGRRKFSDQIVNGLKELAQLKEEAVSPARDRRSYIQVRIPRELLKRFRDATQNRGPHEGNKIPREGNKILSRCLSEWINFHTGNRRKDRWGTRLRPTPEEEFTRRALALLPSPVFRDDPKLARLQFNARNTKLKRNILKLAADLDLTPSQFFCALVERASIDLEKVERDGTAPIPIMDPSFARPN